MISKEIKFLLTHSSIFGMGTIVAKVVAFVLLPIYTRYLTPEDYGVIEIIDITTGTIGIVVSMGIVRSMSRFYYEEREIQYRDSVVSTTFIVYSVIALGFSFLLLSISDLVAEISLKSDQYAYYFVISFSSMLIGGLVDIGLMYLRLIKKSYIYISITISRLCILLFLNILFIVHYEMGVLGILYSSLITKIIFSMGLTSIILHRIGVKFSYDLARSFIKFSMPLVPANLLNWLVNKSDRYFILYFVSIGDTGIYSLAQKLGSITHSFITLPFLMAFAPRRFELIKENPEEAPKVLSLIFSYYTVGMIYLGLIIAILTPEILQVMTTPKYHKAGSIIPIVVLSMIIFGFRYHFEIGIMWSKKTKYFAYINFISSIINISLNFIMIKKYGIKGAVLASFVSILIHSFLLYMVSNRLYYIPFEFFRLSKIFIIAIIFYCVSMYIETGYTIASAAIKMSFIIVFPLILASLDLIKKDEKNKIKGLFVKFNNKIITIFKTLSNKKLI